MDMHALKAGDEVAVAWPHAGGGPTFDIVRVESVGDRGQFYLDNGQIAAPDGRITPWFGSVAYRPFLEAATDSIREGVRRRELVDRIRESLIGVDLWPLERLQRLLSALEDEPDGR